jgi:hypothetical protein
VAPLGRRRAPHGRPLTARRACATTPPKHTGSDLPCRTGSSWQRRGPMGPLGGRGRATVAAFASGTWICEALLRSVIEDPVVRWAMACGVGAALSALAAPCGVTGSLPAAPHRPQTGPARTWRRRPPRERARWPSAAATGVTSPPVRHLPGSCRRPLRILQHRPLPGLRRLRPLQPRPVSSPSPSQATTTAASPPVTPPAGHRGDASVPQAPTWAAAGA